MGKKIEAKNKICYHCGKSKNYKVMIERDEYSVCVKCLVSSALPLYGHSFQYWDDLTIEREEEAKEIWEEIKGKVPINEYLRLYKWASVFHCVNLVSIERCILRALLGRNKVVKEAVEEIIAKQSVDDILPMGF